MKRLIPGFFLLILATACTDDQAPEGIIGNEKMISVLTDVHLVDSYLNSAAYDTTTQPAANYYRIVYKKYQIDSLQFQKNLRYYSRKTELLDTMYHQVLLRLEKMERAENLEEQMKIKAKEAVDTQKQNSKIRLKPQPNWFFNYDTSTLFNRKPPIMSRPAEI